MSKKKSFFDKLISGDKKAIRKLYKAALFIILFFIVITLILFGFLVSIENFDTGKLGALGDFFAGFLNPILTFITFMVLLFTIFNQSEELKLTRKELEISTQELEKSANALKGQEELLKHQQFETTFFNLLKARDEAFNNFVISGFTTTTKQDKNIREYYKNISSIFIYINKFKLENNLKSYQSIILTAESYFHVLANITQLIHSTCLHQETYYNYLISSLKYEEKLFLLEVNKNRRPSL